MTTEILVRYDPRAKSAKMAEDKNAEVHNLMRRGIFQMNTSIISLRTAMCSPEDL